jgi:hypothetical protein
MGRRLYVNHVAMVQRMAMDEWLITSSTVSPTLRINFQKCCDGNAM